MQENDLSDAEAVERPASDPDGPAIRAVLSGSASAFAAIVERNHRALHRVLTGVLCDPHAADDVAQEVWLIVYRRLGQFGFRSLFRTWLSRIAVREALSTRQRLRRLLARRVPLTDAVAAPAPAAAEHEETRRLLARLPAAERAAFVLHVEGYRYGEIALALACPEGTVATRIHRARQRLARLCASQAPAPGTLLPLAAEAEHRLHQKVER